MKFPADAYVFSGFFTNENVPSPKLQFHEVGVFALVSLNDTASGAVPERNV